MEEVEKKR